MESVQRSDSRGGGVIAMTLSVPDSAGQNTAFNVGVQSNNSPNTSGSLSGSNGTFSNLPSTVAAGTTYTDVTISSFGGNDGGRAYATITLSQSGCSDAPYNIYQS